MHASNQVRIPFCPRRENLREKCQIDSAVSDPLTFREKLLWMTQCLISLSSVSLHRMPRFNKSTLLNIWCLDIFHYFYQVHFYLAVKRIELWHWIGSPLHSLLSYWFSCSYESQIGMENNEPHMNHCILILININLFLHLYLIICHYIRYDFNMYIYENQCYLCWKS